VFVLLGVCGGTTFGQVPEHRIAPTDPPAAVDDLLKALDGGDRAAGFAALCRLAVAGYRPDVARRLLAIAADSAGEESWREYAAMGLGNMHAMPEEERARVRAALRDALAAERADVPDGVARLMVRLGDAAFVREALGGSLEGKPYEIDVLARLADPTSRQRLLAIHSAAPGRKSATYAARFAVARALAAHGDPLGIDLLVQLLDPAGAPGFQHRHNVWAFLVRLTGAPFAFVPAATDADLDAAVAAFRQWWDARRDALWLPPPEAVREPGAVGPSAREAVDAWRAGARAREGAWLLAPVLGALFPAYSFFAVRGPRDGDAGTTRTTTLAVRDGTVAHVLADDARGEAFGALLHEADVKVVEPADARAVWSAWSALQSSALPLGEARRIAPDTWWLVLRTGDGRPTRYEIATGDGGVVLRARLQTDD